MQYSLIKLHLALVLQFLGNAPYTAKSYKDADGNTVQFSSGDPAVNASEIKTKDGKSTYHVHVQVPVGANTFRPVVVQTLDNASRDIISALIVAGFEHKEAVTTTPEVVVPDGANNEA